MGCRALVWVLSEPQILIFAAVQLLFVLKVQGIVKPLKCRTLGASWHFKMLKTILWLSGVKLEILLQVIKQIWIHVGESKAKALKLDPSPGKTALRNPGLYFPHLKSMPGTRAALFTAETPQSQTGLVGSCSHTSPSTRSCPRPWLGEY